LSALASVHAAHDDPEWTIDDLVLAVRRAIEDQTFEPDSGRTGVHLLDDQAARYGDFDDVVIVGVVENDWPERPAGTSSTRLPCQVARGRPKGPAPQTTHGFSICWHWRRAAPSSPPSRWTTTRWCHDRPSSTRFLRTVVVLARAEDDARVFFEEGCADPPA
jgi:hypothetical protein